MKPFYFKLRLGFYILSCLCALASMFLASTTWPFLTAAGLFFIAGYAVTLKHCRCPSCKRVLPSRIKTPDRCPFCGAALKEDHL
ncbi:MAG: hypothetical protein MJ085_02435 [Clostridia bacterium]|nr:hypothetical protein [Clostridia bacterium]